MSSLQYHPVGGTFLEGDAGELIRVDGKTDGAAENFS